MGYCKSVCEKNLAKKRKGRASSSMVGVLVIFESSVSVTVITLNPFKTF